MAYETQYTIPLACTIWSCKGTLWSELGNFSESYTGRDIVFYTETHQSPECPLPPVDGSTWESTYREETRDTGVVRGSKGVDVLFDQHYSVPFLSYDVIPTHVSYGFVCGISQLVTSL